MHAHLDGTRDLLLFRQILVPVAILGHLDVGASGAPFGDGERASSISSVGPDSCCADTPLGLAAAGPVAHAGPADGGAAPGGGGGGTLAAARRAASTSIDIRRT